MSKNSVHLGEVVGFTVGKLFDGSISVINVQFDIFDDAEGHCDSMNGLDSTSVYFPIKLTSLANMHQKEKVYD